MIEYTGPQRGRPRQYCWICLSQGCAVPRQAAGDLSIWSSERALPPTLAGEKPWPWLNGPPAGWWYTRSQQRAA